MISEINLQYLTIQNPNLSLSKLPTHQLIHSPVTHKNLQKRSSLAISKFDHPKMSQNITSNDSDVRSGCQWCIQDNAPCPLCEYVRLFETPRSETHDMETVTEESIARFVAERERGLQAFLEVHRDSTATTKQLTKIYNLNLSNRDKESLVAWIEEPRCFTPLLRVSQVVFECAMTLAVEEQEEKFWMRDVVRELELEYKDIFEPEMTEAGIAIATEIYRRRTEEPTARRNAIVQAHLDEWAQKHGEERFHAMNGAVHPHQR